MDKKKKKMWFASAVAPKYLKACRTSFFSWMKGILMGYEVIILIRTVIKKLVNVGK